MMITKYLTTVRVSSVAIFILVAGCAAAPVPPSVDLMSNIDAFGNACIPDSEFALNGISMDMPEPAVVARLGEPEQRLPIPPDSDLPMNSIVYDGLIVYLFREQVVELDATTSDWQTPSGLRVGLTQADMVNILGRLPMRSDIYPERVVYGIPNCIYNRAEALGWSLMIYMDAQDRIESISFQRDWP